MNWHPIHTSSWRAGFTIIEVLAVVMILALVSGVVSVRISAANRTAERQASASMIRELDAHARLLAQQGQSIVLSVHDDGTHLELRRVFETEAIATRLLPSPFTLTVRSFSQPSENVHAIAYDTCGCCGDYLITIADPTSSDSHTLALYGISGQFVAQDPRP
jgi:prepilin-type N-terminal cleavage/methylation domain-containing protein